MVRAGQGMGWWERVEAGKINPHPNPLPEGEGTKGKGFRANVVEVQLEIDRDSDFEELVNSRLKVRHRTRCF